MAADVSITLPKVLGTGWHQRSLLTIELALHEQSVSARRSDTRDFIHRVPHSWCCNSVNFAGDGMNLQQHGEKGK